MIHVMENIWWMEGGAPIRIVGAYAKQMLSKVCVLCVLVEVDTVFCYCRRLLFSWLCSFHGIKGCDKKTYEKRVYKQHTQEETEAMGHALLKKFYLTSPIYAHTSVSGVHPHVRVHGANSGLLLYHLLVVANIHVLELSLLHPKIGNASSSNGTCNSVPVELR